MPSAGSKCQFRCRVLNRKMLFGCWVLNRIGDQMLSAESKDGVQMLSAESNWWSNAECWIERWCSDAECWIELVIKCWVLNRKMVFACWVLNRIGDQMLSAESKDGVRMLSAESNWWPDAECWIITSHSTPSLNTSREHISWTTSEHQADILWWTSFEFDLSHHRSEILHGRCDVMQSCDAIRSFALSIRIRSSNSICDGAMWCSHAMHCDTTHSSVQSSIPYDLGRPWFLVLGSWFLAIRRAPRSLGSLQMIWWDTSVEHDVSFHINGSWFQHQQQIMISTWLQIMIATAISLHTWRLRGVVAAASQISP
jgi:hypothetical protein